MIQHIDITIYITLKTIYLIEYIYSVSVVYLDNIELYLFYVALTFKTLAKF